MPKTEVTGSQIKDQSVSLSVDVTGVLPVANGGSGSNTIALNNVVLGNGSGAVQTVAPGASGNVLTSNGTTWVSENVPYPVSSVAGKTGAVTLTASDVGLSNAERQNNKAVANGYASLDSNGKVPGSQLPNSIMTYEGLHNVSTNSPALTDASGDAGQVYRISVGGTRNYGSGNITLNVGDYLIHNGSVWEFADTTDAVSTVNGYTGNITLHNLKHLHS